MQCETVYWLIFSAIVTMNSLEEKRWSDLPVTSAFWSCPLIPVLQGLTIANLLVLQRYIPMLEITRKTAPPIITPAKIGTWFFFDSGGRESEAFLFGDSEAFWIGESEDGLEECEGKDL